MEGLIGALQAIIPGVALLAAIYAVFLQRRELISQRQEQSRNQELSAAATLFAYYNQKISSLRDSIYRDTQDKSLLRTESSVDERVAQLDELLKAHKAVRDRLERLYAQVLPAQS
jgi:hypothetical protein